MVVLGSRASPMSTTGWNVFAASGGPGSRPTPKASSLLARNFNVDAYHNNAFLTVLGTLLTGRSRSYNYDQVHALQ